MFAAIDWNEVLRHAQAGGVAGGCIGFVAYLMRKLNGQKQAEAGAHEHANMDAPVHAAAAKPTSRWRLFAATLGIVAATVLIVNPSLVISLFRNRNATQTGVTIIDYGRYQTPGLLRVVADGDSPGNVRVDRSRDVVLLDQTDQIPCRVGEAWGFRIRKPDVPLNRSYTVREETDHPPIKYPDGSVRTKHVREIKRGRGEAPERFYGWHFLKGYEYEMVTGEWSVVVFIDDVEVARMAFNIYK